MKNIHEESIEEKKKCVNGIRNTIEIFSSSHYRSSNNMILEYKRRFLFFCVYCIFKRKTDVTTGFLFAFKKREKKTNFDVSKMCLIPYVFIKQKKKGRCSNTL
jgi:hypothetical protein